MNALIYGLFPYYANPLADPIDFHVVWMSSRRKDDEDVGATTIIITS